MLAVAFDTLKLARKLESAGMPSKQAQDTSAALSETFTEWLSIGNIATREDVHELRNATREDMQKLRDATQEDINELRGELHEVRDELKTAISRLDARLSETKAEIMKWMFGQTVFLVAALYGLIHINGKL